MHEPRCVMTALSQSESRAARRLLRTWFKHNADGICLLVLFATVFSVVAFSGNFTPAPRLVDENQIYLLAHQIDEQGLGWVVRDHFTHRIVDMNRLVPVYLLHKIGLVWVFGENLLGWHVYMATLGAVTAWLLYGFGRLLRLSAAEAIAFSLIVVLGEQSVVWLRLFHAEGVGLFFTALALVFAGLEHRSRDGTIAYPFCFVACAMIASLSKESFILVLPALVVVWLLLSRRSGREWLCRQNVWLASAMGAIFLSELFVIRFAFEETHFHYTGWFGFDAERFRTALADVFAPQRSWIFIVSTVAGLVGILHLRRAKGTRQAAAETALGAAVLFLVSLLIVLPQVLLYMSSGFSADAVFDGSRFLIPASLGLAGLAVIPVSWARKTVESSEHRSRFPVRTFPALATAVVVGYLVVRYSTAMTTATAYADRGADRHDYLEAIARHTSTDDRVLVGFGGVQTADEPLQPRRLAVMLSEYLELGNVWYLPVTGSEPRDVFEYDWHGLDDHITRRMEDRTLWSGHERAPYDTVLIPNVGYQYVELPFILQENDWFVPEEYFRFRNDYGDVAYFRIQPLPYYLEGYREFLPSVTVSSVALESGMLRLRGVAQAPEGIGGIGLYVDGSAIEARVTMERSFQPYRYFKWYALETVSFTLEARLPATTSGEMPTLKIYSGDKTVATAPIVLPNQD